jgi:rRNA-processing protein FCF1
VLLDTNSLFLPVRSRFPLEAEVERCCPGAELAVLSTTVAELGRLVRDGVAGSAAAQEYAGRFPVVAASGRGDDAVVAAAVARAAAVVTADRNLADRLVARQVTVLVPRDRHRLHALAGRPARRRNPARIGWSHARRGNG